MDMQEKLEDEFTYQGRITKLRQELERSESGLVNTVLGVLASFKAHSKSPTLPRIYTLL
jgi:hypothetical protein